MAKRLPPYLTAGQDQNSMENQVRMEEWRRTIEGVGGKLPQELYREPLTEDNQAGLFTGSHIIPKLEKADTYITAVGVLPKITAQIPIQADVYLDGLAIQLPNDAVSIAISGGATVVLHKLRILKASTHETSFISVAAGCRLIMIGCVFKGGDGAATVIANSAAVGDVQLIGCYNKTGAPIGTVTNVGSFL